MSENTKEMYRSTKHIYHQKRFAFIMASLASNSTAAAFHIRRPTVHAGAAPVRGAATYRILDR